MRTGVGLAYFRASWAHEYYRAFYEWAGHVSSIKFYDHIGSPTMFWARQGALSNLYNLGLSWDDYPEEPLGYDGTMLHAIERLLPQICMASGKRYAMTHVPGFSR